MTMMRNPQIMYKKTSQYIRETVINDIYTIQYTFEHKQSCENC